MRAPATYAVAVPRPSYLDPQSLGEALRLLRHRAGCSRGDLAAVVGVSTGALSNYENDVSVPSASALRRLTRVIAERLDCEVPALWEQLGGTLDAGGGWSLVASDGEQLEDQG